VCQDNATGLASFLRAEHRSTPLLGNITMLTTSRGYHGFQMVELFQQLGISSAALRNSLGFSLRSLFGLRPFLAAASSAWR
jgi:hypothetical protein